MSYALKKLKQSIKENTNNTTDSKLDSKLDLVSKMELESILDSVDIDCFDLLRKSRNDDKIDSNHFRF